MILKIILIAVIVLITAFFTLSLFAALAAAGAADRETKTQEPPTQRPSDGGKIYISGAIGRNPDYKQQFAASEAKLSAEGWEVINPAKVSAALPALPYSAYMQISLVLLSCASAIYMLNGWETSTGAVTEKQAAESLGLTIIYQTEKTCNISAEKAESQNISRR